jgi:hypothetical protein
MASDLSTPSPSIGSLPSTIDKKASQLVQIQAPELEQVVEVEGEHDVFGDAQKDGQVEYKTLNW